MHSWVWNKLLTVTGKTDASMKYQASCNCSHNFFEGENFFSPIFISCSSIMVISSFFFHYKNTYLKTKTPSSVSKFENFNQATEYKKYYKCSCISTQNYLNWVLKVIRSLLLFFSDGASISGAVSTVHCYHKHLSERNLPIWKQKYQILREQNFMELCTFSWLSQNPRNEIRYPSIHLVLSLMCSMHV